MVENGNIAICQLSVENIYAEMVLLLIQLVVQDIIVIAVINYLLTLTHNIKQKAESSQIRLFVFYGKIPQSISAFTFTNFKLSSPSSSIITMESLVM
jgi:hypothetical protein